MAGVKLYLNPRVKLNGNQALKLSIHVNRTTVRHDIGIEIPKNKWNERQESITKDHNGISKEQLNEMALKHKIRALALVTELNQDERILNMTAKEVENLLYNSCLQEKKLSFVEFFDQYIKRLDAIGSFGTARTYKYSFNTLKSFDKSNRSFNEFDYSFIKRLDEYLIIKKLSANSRSVIHRTMKALYNYAIKELEYVDRFSNPYLDFKIVQQTTKKRNICLDEVKSIYNYQGKHEAARDFFIFSFLCIGMDFVDMAYLKHSDIENGRIVYARRKVTKTKCELSIKVTDEIQVLIDKYGCKEYVFPFLELANTDKEKYQKYLNARRLYNKTLSKLQGELNIELDMTSKVSRHSWATSAKKLGYSKDLISEMLGHKAPGVAVTDIYLDDFDIEAKDKCHTQVISELVSRR